MVAARVKQMQSFMALMQMANHADCTSSPARCSRSRACPVVAETILNRIDPLTYAVDPMRRAVFAHLHISPVARHALDPGVTWWGWHIPGLVEAAVVGLIGLVMLAVAIAQFSRADVSAAAGPCSMACAETPGRDPGSRSRRSSRRCGCLRSARRWSLSV